MFLRPSHRWLILCLLFPLLLTPLSCRKDPGTNPDLSLPRPAILPDPTTPVRVTPADIALAPQYASDPQLKQAIDRYLSFTPDSIHQWKLSAVRPLDHGRYLLLWIYFPNIADSGLELVYFTDDHKIHWQFRSWGYRG